MKALHAGDDWETVYLFVSSTFNDMHAERDYLTKQVFPALRAWCARRRLEFIDVDLRWGITDEQAMETYRTLQICLENVERCRPLFLGLVGQRRGWVPSAEDVTRAVQGEKEISRNLSITQWELWKGMQIPGITGVIFRRDPAALEGMPRQGAYAANYLGYDLDPRTRRATPDTAAEASQTRFWEALPRLSSFAVQTYTARWDPDLPCPELEGLELAGCPVPELTRGRLTDFTCQGRPWAEVVLALLRQEICRLYPDRQELPALQGLAAELQAQRLHLRRQSAFYIAPLKPWPDPLARKETWAFTIAQISGESGSGKSAWLAHLIQTRDRKHLYYRFCGISPDSTREEALLLSVARQWYEDGLLRQEPAGADIVNRFPLLLNEAARRCGDLVLIVDGLDELDGGQATLTWCRRANYPRPRDHTQLVFSVRSGTPAAEKLAKMQFLWQLPSFADREDRRRYLDAELGRCLKQLEPDQLNRLADAPHGDSPLYLQEVLFELTQHGNRRTLNRKLTELLPLDAAGVAHRILDRMEADSAYLPLVPRTFLAAMLGLLADARYGLTEADLLATLPLRGQPDHPDELLAALRHYARQLRPFLIWRGERLCFFYTIWREVCLQRYGGRSHAALATRFLALCDEQPDGFHGQDPLAYREFSYHATRTDPDGPLYRRLTELPFHLPWVYAKLHCCGAAALAEEQALLPPDRRCRGLERFYRNCQDLLHARPAFLPELLATHRPEVPLDTTTLRFLLSARDWHRPLGLPVQVLPVDAALFLQEHPCWAGSFRLPGDTGPVTELRPLGDALLVVGPPDQYQCPLFHRQTGRRLGFLPRNARWWPAVHRYVAFDKNLLALCLYDPETLTPHTLVEGCTPSLMNDSNTCFCFYENTLYCLLGAKDSELNMPTSFGGMPFHLRFRALTLRPDSKGGFQVDTYTASLPTGVFSDLRMDAGPAGCALVLPDTPLLQLFFWSAEEHRLSRPWQLRLPDDRRNPVLSGHKLTQDPLRAPVQGQCDPLGVHLCGTTAWVWLCVPTDRDTALLEEGNAVDIREEFFYHTLYAVSVRDGTSGRGIATAAVQAGDALYAFANLILPLVTTVKDHRLQAPGYQARVTVYDAATGRLRQPARALPPFQHPPCFCAGFWLRDAPGGVAVLRDPADSDWQALLTLPGTYWAADDHRLYLLDEGGTVSQYDLDKLSPEGPGAGESLLQTMGPTPRGSMVWFSVTADGAVEGKRFHQNQWVSFLRYRLQWQKDQYRPSLFLIDGLPVVSYTYLRADEPGQAPFPHMAVIGNRMEKGGFRSVYWTVRHQQSVQLAPGANGKPRTFVDRQDLPLREIQVGEHTLWLVFYRPARRRDKVAREISQNTLENSFDLIVADRATFNPLPAWQQKGQKAAAQLFQPLPGTGLATAVRGDTLCLCTAGAHARDGEPGTRLYRMQADTLPTLIWEQDTGLPAPTMLWEQDRLWLTLPGPDGAPTACTLTVPEEGTPTVAERFPLPADFPLLAAVRRGILLLIEAHHTGLALYHPARRQILWQLRFDAQVVSAQWPTDSFLLLHYRLAGRQRVCLLPLLGYEALWT